MHAEKKDDIFGLAAEFASPEALLHAAEHVRDAGYKNADAYAPVPVHGLTEAMGFPKTRVPLIVLIGGIVGGLSGYFMQYYSFALSYPLIIAGRQLYSWPNYVPIAYECTILFAAFAACFGMFALNGLPQPYHPMFNVPSFAASASKDKFFICIEKKDPKFNMDETRKFLEALGPVEVSVVAA